MLHLDLGEIVHRRCGCVSRAVGKGFRDFASGNLG